MKKRNGYEQSKMGTVGAAPATYMYSTPHHKSIAASPPSPHWRDGGGVINN
jgi:hypothetical protein